MTANGTLAQRLDAGIAQHRLGKVQEAEGHYLGVLALDPTHVEARKLLAVIALDREEFERAAELIGAVLSEQPHSGEYWHLLGRIRLRQGDFQDALRCLKRAVSFKAPELGSALVDLSACLSKLRAWQQALTAARSALALAPNDEAAHRIAGHACFALDRHEEAVDHFERALAKDAEQASLLHLASISLCRVGRPLEAYARAASACSLAPGNAEYSWQRRVAGAAAVPDWHFNMVNDGPRNTAFAAAIGAVVGRGQRVLEIGTGSGLLAMLAARGDDGEARASEVVTCEANPLLARTATSIVAANELADRVTVVPKPSFDLRLGIDLAARADVLICEILSVQVIAEGVLPALEDAKLRLLVPGAIVIPAAAIARAALVANEGLGRRTRVERVFGFDLSQLNEFTPALQYLSTEQELDLLSDPADLFRFDLANSDSFPSERKTVSMVARSAGLCQGVVQWLRLELAPGIEFENRPGSQEAAGSRHWHPVFYPFPDPVSVAAGQVLTVRASHNRSGMNVVLVGEG